LVLAGTCRVGMPSPATPVVGIVEIDSVSAAKWLGLGNRLGLAAEPKFASLVQPLNRCLIAWMVKAPRSLF
jgi:hypothetical protein